MIKNPLQFFYMVSSISVSVYTCLSINLRLNVSISACHCDSTGSESLLCEKYGGQCDCKPNVIGRRCNKCQPDYYNFSSGTGCTGLFAAISLLPCFRCLSEVLVMVIVMMIVMLLLMMIIYDAAHVDL